MNPSKFSPSSEAWRGAAVGVFIATLLLVALSTIDLIEQNVSWGNAAIYFAVGSLIAALIGGFLVFLSVLYANIPTPLKWALACFTVCVYYFFNLKQSALGLLLIGTWALVSFSLTCGALWSLITRRNENRLSTLAYLLLGLLGIASLFFWLNWRTPVSLPETMEGKKEIVQIDLPDPGLPGKFSVQTLPYGSGEEIKAKTVNGEPFIQNWDGISGWLRTRYWGFGPANIPLNGRVWYPEGNGPFPLVLIVHGNHEMSVPSEKGYAYLAQLWASRGFIAVSIDQNFLNGAWTDFKDELYEVSARGWLILEHLKLWREWNSAPDSPFFNKVDMQNIALVGHSRGGEAIATAAALNNVDRFPDDGRIGFDYHFNIRALAAISPVDAQYHPGGKKTSLNDIDYFVMHGSHDGDVRSFQGAGQYSRIHFKDPQYHFKAALYVFGANHARFNTEWGTKDVESPSSLFFNSQQFLKTNEQQQTAKVYLTAFLEAVLHEEKGYMPLFHTWRTGREWLPKTVYLNEFSDSNETVIVDNEKTLDPGKTTLHAGTIQGAHLQTWSHKKINTRENQAYHTGTYLGWDTLSGIRLPSYTITLPKNGLKVDPESILVLTLADSSDNDEEKEEKSKTGKPIDFTIQLTDGSGETASLTLSHDAFLQPAISASVMKSNILDPLNASESVFQTFEFPLKDFMAVNPNFDASTLHKISLKFDQTTSGLIVVRSISIRKH